MAALEETFDELLGRGADEESASPAPIPSPAPPASRSAWVLAASIGCVLIGTASVIGAWLILPFGQVAELPEPASVSAPVPAPAEDAAASAPASTASPPGRSGASDPGSLVDDAWVVRVAKRTAIPERALAAYVGAAQRLRAEDPGCRLGWNTLAGIGFVESVHGTIGGSSVARDGNVRPEIVGIPLDGTRSDAIADTDAGALDGDPVWDRAVGPMQFIPSTWAEWGSDGNDDGIADPHHIDDAAYSAARYLCHTGNLTDPSAWIAAIASYNTSLDYNHRVADAASRYAGLDPA